MLDTSILVDHLRASTPATEYLAGLDGRPACSEISRIEVIQGLRSAEKRVAARLFALIEWVPVTEAIARRAGDLGRRWRRSHPGIGVADLAIAATAEQLDATLATRNIKHFPMFKGLRAPY
ncbi:MAG TPA: type II toxin-antitoxin system VapC family toxin [Solirubrobacterales bacterium]|nr:type II toxin-antitoxin system VapC family toxin [Solirubrobacterales bacterium]